MIINNKTVPTRVPDRKGDQENCLDLCMVTPKLFKNAFKEITFRLDMEVFGVKYKRSHTTQKSLGKYKEK